MWLLRCWAARCAPILLVASVAVAGCGGIATGDNQLGDAHDPDIAEASQAIAGGYGDIDDTAVVGIAVTDGAGGLVRSCSGTLIAPNLVLTAQHCIASTAHFVICDEASFGAPVAADRVLTTTSTEMWSEDTVWRTAKEVLAPPGGAAVCGRDVALVVLSQPVPEGEAIPMTPRLDKEVSSYEEYSAIGYGSSAHELGDSGFRRRRDGLIVTCVGSVCSEEGHVDGREWRGDYGICNGDSGGPALDVDGHLMGVTSRGPSGCDDPIYGGITSWRDWIRGVGAQAMAAGNYPAPEWMDAAPLETTEEPQQAAACTVSRSAPSNPPCVVAFAMLASLLGIWRRRTR